MGTNLSNAQIQQLWISNGGIPGWAPFAAAIAAAESGGNYGALNNNPSTGDYSVGLWQINYYNGLSASRTASYGSPSALLADPNLQAQAAVNLSGNGSNWGPWRTDAAYNAWVRNGSPNQPTQAQVAAWGVSLGGSSNTTVQPGTTSGSSGVVTAYTGPEPSLTGLAYNPGAGFGALAVADFTIQGQGLGVNVEEAVSNIILNRTISTASTLTMQLADPQRLILRQNIWQFGLMVNVDGLSFTLVQVTKASDTLQVVFESSGVAALRQQVGVQATTTTNDITTFIGSLVSVIPGLGFVGFIGAAFEDPEQTEAVSIGRGTTQDPYEDSWTCIQRVATSAGWRCFECNNVVYLGPDTFFLTAPNAGTLTEFTPSINNMDFDYDIGKPFGTVTVTGMTISWGFNPGQVVQTKEMGPLDGQPWLIQSMQRGLYSPQMTAVLYAPQTPQFTIASPTYAPY